MSDYSEPRRNSGAADFAKDPDAVLDYAFDWSIPLNGDQIIGSQFLLPDGLTQVSSSFEGARTQVFLSGGDAEVIYRVTNRIQTAGGRVFDRTIRIVVREQ